MDLRGQRFELDLSDDDDEGGSSSILESDAMPSIPSAFIKDITERTTTPPTAPKLKSTPTGFPEHKKRARISAFKRQRGGATNPTPADSHNAFARPVSKPGSVADLAQMTSGFDEDDRRRIDEENKQRLETMSAEEIEEERNALFSSLDPALIQRFLTRTNLDEGRGDTGLYPKEESETRTQAPSKYEKFDMGISHPNPSGKLVETPRSVKLEEEKEPEGKEFKEGKESIEDTKSPSKPREAERGVQVPKPSGKRVEIPASVRFDDDKEPAEPPIDLQPASEDLKQDISELLPPSVHFPSAPAVPDLDPSDPSFLENLHSKYFPDLPADPSKLAWMAPIPTHGSLEDQDSPYYPAKDAIPASALRFNFRGGLIPPRIARAVPSTLGLHHHGEAPEAAGYTIPELARLARSAFPAQRCIAFQTLGRLLYRLGRGEWGDEDSEVAKGIWRCVEEGKITQTLEEASSAEGGHQGSNVYAIEAAWLWRKGGGKVWKAS